MKIEAYLFTLNKNSSFKLNTDDLKDVKQEIDIYLINKVYNDLLIKKTVFSHFLKAIKAKTKNENIIYDCPEFETIDHDQDENKERRINALKKLSLNDREQKIIKLLIEGYKYPEIRKRLKLNSNKLKSTIKRIKEKNAVI